MNYQHIIYDDLTKYAPRVMRSALKKGYLDSDIDIDNTSNHDHIEKSSKFYCLYGNLLYIYENENSTTFHGILFLEGCTIKKSIKSNNDFNIITVSGKNYNFSINNKCYLKMKIWKQI